MSCLLFKFNFFVCLKVFFNELEKNVLLIFCKFFINLLIVCCFCLFKLLLIVIENDKFCDCEDLLINVLLLLFLL